MAIRIRDETLSASGTLALNLAMEVTDPYEVINDGAASLSATKAGASASLGGTFSVEVTGGTPFYTSDLSLTVQTGIGGEEDSDNYALTNSLTPFPDFTDGAYTIDVDVTLMWECGVTPGPDVTNGVFHTAPPASAQFYYETRIGGSVTVTASAGPLTATKTSTITAAVPVSDIASLYASVSVSSSSMGGYVDAEVKLPDTVGTKSVSSANGLAKTTDGAKARIILPNGPTSATASLTATRPRIFALTSKLNAVDSDFPGSVDYVCSRYLGDTSPGFTAGATASRGGTQAYIDESVGVTGDNAASVSDAQTLETRQAVSLTLDPDWCDANGEYVTYTTDAGTQTLRNSLFQMQGWLLNALTLSQDAEYVVDDCTAATDWTGMATGGGGLQNTGASATKTLDTSFAGYAYLRVNAACESGTASRTLTVNGKTWKVPLTATAADVDIDLLNPLTGGANTDTTETKWPLDVSAHDTTNGPLEGIAYITALTLSGLDSAHPDTYHGFSLVRKDGTQVSVMEAWAPRAATDQPEFSPPATNESGTTTTTYANRGIVALTDGRQSLEEWFHVHDHIETASGEGDSWGQRAQTIAGLAGVTENVPGWHATIDAPADDTTDNLHDGYLNRDAPAYWIMGAGLLYVGGESPWLSGVGMALGESMSLQARPLFTTLTDWPPGIGDVFGVGLTGVDPGAIQIPASKVLRAQAHGVLVKTGGGRKDGADVTLTPASGELQSDTTAIGSATSATDGSFRTTGAGLTGYTGGGAGSAGVVASGTRSATQAFKSAWLGWVGLRIAAAITGRHPSNTHSRFGPYHSVKVGTDGGVLYSRSDHAAPWTAVGGYVLSALPVPADTDATDTEPRLTIGPDSRLWLTFTRPADGVRQAYSDDDGSSWSESTLLMAGAAHPAPCTTPTGTLIFGAYDSGNLKARVQHPGDISPAAAVTLTDDTGTPIAVEDDSFGLSAGFAGSAPILLYCMIAGETEPSDWVCHDESNLSFTRVT